MHARNSTSTSCTLLCMTMVVSLSSTRETREVDGGGVDERDLLRRRRTPHQLHERELRVIRALPMELGVEADDRFAFERADDIIEVVLGVDPARQAGPCSTGWPASSHALLPPATFTVS